MGELCSMHQDAWHKAIALHRQGRWAEAEGIYESLLRRDPDNALALHHLALARHHLGRADSAEALLRRAVAIDPGYAQAHNNLGVMLHAAGRVAEACGCFTLACQSAPSLAPLWLHRGVALAALDRLEDSRACLRRAVDLAPDAADTWGNLGAVLARLRDPQAEAVSRRALELNPDHPVALKALGDLLLPGDEAVALYRRAAAAGDAEALCKLGTALRLRGALAAAEEAFRRALAARPDDAASHFGLALTLLAAGRYAEAWPDFEWRLKLSGATPPLPGPPLWRGDDLAGRTLLLTDEQGLGDTLQFIRFAAGLGGRVVLRCRPELVPLLRGAAGLAAVVGRDEPVPDADVQAPLLSLPALRDAVPDGRPYLAPPPDRLEHWKSRLAGIAGLKVGVAWAGNPAHPFDALRSLPAGALALLPRVEGVTYVVLQLGERAAELREGVPLDVKDFADTAAVISQLDLVISADTAVAHLAGALGTPVWLALPWAADWRWMVGGDDSPWYASARLYRQTAPDDWEAVLLRLGRDLVGRLRRPKRKPAADWLRETETAFAAGTLRAAERALWNALMAGAADEDGLRMLAAVRLRDEDAAGAVHLCRASLGRRPDIDTCSNLGVALRRLGRSDEAAVALRQACQLAPGHAGARYNLANLLGDLGRLEEALALYREVVALEPGHGAAHYNLANALRDLGRLDEAVAAYHQALAVDPGNEAELRNSLGMCLLLGGRYAEGWGEYEARWRLGRLPDRALAQPAWDGSPGRTVLLHAEQGFGDTLQFARYAALAAQAGARVVLEVQPGLAALCRTVPGVAGVLAQGDPVPAIDAQLPLLSLPRVLGLPRPEDAPPGPYLWAEPRLTAEWGQQLAGLGGVKVGLVWAGNPRHRNDARRSLPLSAFAGLPAGAGFSYVSLQLGPAQAELAASPMRGAILDLAPRIRDFSDTAAILRHLDLVICCDTAVAHLAGALGRPVWLLLPHAPDWRWGLNSETSPWYRGMRLFRQPAPGDWATPLRRLAEELRRFEPPQPDPDALQQLALAHLADNRLGEAEDLLRQAVAAAPRFAAAWSNLGIVLRRAGRLDDAAAAYRTALELAPGYHEARYNLGNALRAANRSAEAVECFRAVAAARPDHFDAWNNLGLTLQDLKRFDQAEAALRHARALAPGQAEPAANLALLYHAAKRHDDAVAVATDAAGRWPSHPLVQRTWALTLKAVDRVAEAESVCRAALRLEPGNAEGFNLLGSILTAQNRLDEAAAVLNQALALSPDYAEARWMLGFVELLRGELRSGWRHFESRWRLGMLAPQVARMTRPHWDGRPLAGQTLLVHAEQGIGDSFHFARYLPLAAARGARVVVEAQATVLPLLARMPGVAATVAQGQPLPEHDWHVPLLTLPRIFDTTLATIPAEPYLTADPARRDRWRDHMAGLPGRRVGLVWAGNPDHGNDRNRSLSLELLAPLLAVPGISLVSLQKGRQAPPPALDLDIADYEDTAAILSELDLLLSVDTSVAHCAGALGRPVWTLLPFAPDWRWLLRRSDTPWYPTMRLYRQPQPGQWRPVIEAVARDLVRWVARA